MADKISTSAEISAPASMRAMIELTDIRKHYGEHEALRGISLQVE